MNILLNMDLLAVGIATATIGILGSVIYLSNKKSITNISFLFFSFITILYSVINYISYQQSFSPTVSLWLFRLVIFSATWHAFSLFQLFYVFPSEKVKFSKSYTWGLVPVVAIVSILNLTPFVFSSINTTTTSWHANVEKGIIAFGLLVVTLIVSSIFLLVKKTIKSADQQKKQLELVLIGTIITFSLLITFNFVMPALMNQLRFLPWAPVFILPFVAFTFYSILKYGLMKVKVASAEILVLALSLVSFAEIVIAKDPALIIYRSFVFILILGFGILLIRSVVKEVKQREKIEKLAIDLSKANDKLKVANDKLKELDKQKTEFVSIASHQLRSPLTAIKGYTSMLLEGSFGPVEAQAREAIDRVFQSSLKLVKVIEDFLNITRIELGKMKYEISVFDLGQLAQTVTKDQEPNVKKRGLTIEFQDGSGNHQISADSGKVTQVVSNIIDNSIKYTPSGGVKINVVNLPAGKSKTKEMVRLTVSDTGVGIPKETLNKLFEKFVRADDAGKTNISGTGLGLYVAKQIVEGLGGKIWAESEGKGKGSQFIVEFPRSSEQVTQVKSQVQSYTKADLPALSKVEEGKLQNTKK